MGLQLQTLFSGRKLCPFTPDHDSAFGPRFMGLAADPVTRLALSFSVSCILVDSDGGRTQSTV